jgi:hypothetical protein
MTKEKIISEIKSIIRDYGSFGVADIHADCSPMVASIGKDACQLAEHFYKDKTEVVTYIHENETNSEFIAYKDLRNDTLKQILKLAREYKETQE